MEQFFSNLTFIKNDLRSCLLPEHLNMCLRVFHSSHIFTVATFPYKRAFVLWFAEKKRRATLLAANA